MSDGINITRFNLLLHITLTKLLLHFDIIFAKNKENKFHISFQTIILKKEIHFKEITVNYISEKCLV